MRKRIPLLLLAAALAPVALLAKDESCEFTGVERVVAIGDVHGAYAEFQAVLRLAGLIDAKDKWSGGKTHFVQTGDTTDRGSGTRQVLELLMRLEAEARKAGGRVHALLGNHEVMNVMGDLRYVSREEYKSFESPKSRSSYEDLFRSRAIAARQAAKDAKQTFDEASFRRKFEEDFPLGYVERVLAFADDGRYGQWLRQRPAIVKIDGVVFLHGGLTPEVAALGCEAINATVRREITDDIAKTRQQPEASLAAGESGPLWFRGMAREDEAALAAVARARALGHRRAGRGGRAHRHERRPHHAALRRPRGDDRRRHEPALRAQPGRARDRRRRHDERPLP